MPNCVDIRRLHARFAVARSIVCFALSVPILGAPDAAARIAPESAALPQESPGGQPAACKVRVTQVQGRSDLRVSCDGNGARLGEVESYEAATNDATGALAVRASAQGRVRIFLIFPDAAGRPFVQELTRDLAQAVGRNQDAGLEGATIDLTPFADTMAIDVSDQGGASAQAGGHARVDLSPYLVLGQRILLAATADRNLSSEGGVQ